jgi:hypothetical protein
MTRPVLPRGRDIPRPRLGEEPHAVRAELGVLPARDQHLLRPLVPLGGDPGEGRHVVAMRAVGGLDGPAHGMHRRAAAAPLALAAASRRVAAEADQLAIHARREDRLAVLGHLQRQHVRLQGGGPRSATARELSPGAFLPARRTSCEESDCCMVPMRPSQNCTWPRASPLTTVPSGSTCSGATGRHACYDPASRRFIGQRQAEESQMSRCYRSVRARGGTRA